MILLVVALLPCNENENVESVRLDTSKPTQLNEKTSKERLAPYRLYAFFLNSDLPSIKRLGPWRIIIKTGPLARKFKCRHSRLHEWIRWLESQRFLRVEKRSYGEWEIILERPKAASDN